MRLRITKGLKASEMTLEEFKAELRRIREEALHIPSADSSRVNRPKAQQKRGDFFGKGR